LSIKNQEKALVPSEHLFLESEAERESARWWSSCCWWCCNDLPVEVEGTDNLSLSLLLLFNPLEVEGEDFSRCLSSASFIRFRSSGPPTISDLDDPPPNPPRSLYMILLSISFKTPKFRSFLAKFQALRDNMVEKNPRLMENYGFWRIWQFKDEFEKLGLDWREGCGRRELGLFFWWGEGRRFTRERFLSMGSLSLFVFSCHSIPFEDLFFSLRFFYPILIVLSFVGLKGYKGKNTRSSPSFWDIVSAMRKSSPV